jgi:hypothetical protein
MKRRFLLVALLWLSASAALAQYPAVKTTTGEVKRDADFNKPGAAKPSGNYTRVPTQQGRVQQDSDWNRGSRTHFFTPPLRFIGDAGPPGAARPASRPFTTAPLSFAGAAPAQQTEAVVHVTTGKLNFVGVESK